MQWKKGFTQQLHGNKQVKDLFLLSYFFERMSLLHYRKRSDQEVIVNIFNEKDINTPSQIFLQYKIRKTFQLLWSTLQLITQIMNLNEQQDFECF